MMLTVESNNQSDREEGLPQENPSKRIPEPLEIFNPSEALTYIRGCDFKDSSDYAIVAAEIGLAFGNSGKIHGQVAEVCFGPGNLCGELLAIGANKVIGIDASTVMITHAKNKFRQQVIDGQMDFLKGIAQVLPLPNNSVDGIVNFNSFHQFSDGQRAIDALREMVRVLKPGGWGLVRDFKRGALQEDIDKRLEKTKPEIKPLLLNSLTAAFTSTEFRSFLKQIPGIEFSVTDTQNPWRLSESLCERMRNDPVAHWMDFLISQHVIIKKL